LKIIRSPKKTYNHYRIYEKIIIWALGAGIMASLATCCYVKYVYTDSISRPSAAATTVTTIKTSLGIKKVYGVALGDTLIDMSSDHLNNELTNISDIGVKWIRIDMSWADVQPDGPTQFDWTKLDAIVAAAKAHNLKILGTIDYAPTWAMASNCTLNEKCPPTNLNQFASFASDLASRYASSGLQYWEIWNEPNLAGFWEPAPSAEKYTQLLKLTYLAIKKLQPNATVLSGGLGDLDRNPASIKQQAFLTQVYADGAKPYFDVLGFHAYSYPALPSYVALWSGWSMMNDIPDSIRSIMIANGDANKQIWITEYGAPTNGPGSIATDTDPNYDNSPDHVSEALQADMLTQAVDKYKTTSTLGGFFWYSYEDLGTSTDTAENFFGLLNYDGSPKPAYYAYQDELK
jgi:hypothetical protein